MNGGLNKTALKKHAPLYCQIKDILKNQITRGHIKPKDPIPSLYEISQIFGVSMITARQAVGRLLDEGLLYVVSGKGTFVAEKPFKRINIGIGADFDMEILPGQIPMDKPILIHMKGWFDALSIESSSSNCLPIYIPSSLAKKEMTIFIEDNSIAGILLLGIQNLEKILELSLKENIPHVILGELERRTPGINFVVNDNYAGAVKAAQYLVDKGHKRIGIFIGDTSYYGYKERLQGYRDALARNRTVSAAVSEIHCVSGGIEGGYAAAKELLVAKNMPTAILCSSDFKALGAVRAFRENGLRVPEDIAVMGYDGLSFPEEENLPLTTVRISKKEMVREGLDFLLKASLNGTGYAVRKKIEPELIIGKTA